MLNPDLVLIGFCTVAVAAMLLAVDAVVLARIQQVQRRLDVYMQQIRGLLVHEEDWR